MTLKAARQGWPVSLEVRFLAKVAAIIPSASVCRLGGSETVWPAAFCSADSPNVEIIISSFESWQSLYYYFILHLGQTEHVDGSQWPWAASGVLGCSCSHLTAEEETGRGRGDSRGYAGWPCWEVGWALLLQRVEAISTHSQEQRYGAAHSRHPQPSLSAPAPGLWEARAGEAGAALTHPSAATFLLMS